MVEFTEDELDIVQRFIRNAPRDEDFTFQGLTDRVLVLCDGDRGRAQGLARNLGERIAGSVRDHTDTRLRIRFVGRDFKGEPNRSRSNAVIYRRIV